MKRVILGAIAVTLLSACSSSPPAPDPAEQTLRSATTADRQSVIAVDRVLGTRGGADAAARILAQNPSGDTKWFAVYVYANSGTDPAPLRPLLHDKDVAIRVVSATGLVVRGDASGFSVLIDLLTETSTLPASSPPTPVWTVAAETLTRMIGDPSLGPPFDADAGRRTLAYVRWKLWLAANGGKLRFDARTGEWSVS